MPPHLHRAVALCIVAMSPEQIIAEYTMAVAMSGSHCQSFRQAQDLAWVCIPPHQTGCCERLRSLQKLQQRLCCSPGRTSVAPLAHHSPVKGYPQYAILLFVCTFDMKSQDMCTLGDAATHMIATSG